MSITLLLPILLAGEPAKPAAAATDDPPIRIWINNDGRFVRGDRARVHVRAEDDGYLVVLQADAEGHLRVLFPIDPTDDNFVRGGKKYEVEGRGGRDAFDVGDHTGRGTVYAAVSRAPYQFDQFILADHWDYRALEPQRLPEDPEAELTDLVRRMAQGSFDYDVMSYYVVESVVYANDYYRPSSSLYYDDFGCGYYRSCGSGLSVSLFFGRPFYRRHYYSPYYYAYDPFYDPFFYDPYYYRPYYYSPVYYYPAYSYPRYYYPRSYYPYRYRSVYNNYWDRPYTPYRFRGPTVANTDYRDRRYTFGRAVNTVYTPPRSRFTDPETSTPLRRSFDRDQVRSEPTLSRRVSGAIVTDRAKPQRPVERRTDAGTIEARRARPADTPRASDDRSRRETMPVDVTPRRRSSDNSDGNTARRSGDEGSPRATRAEPRPEPRAEPRYEPRAEPRSAPRAEPRAAEPRAAEPRAEPRSSGGSDRGGWSGGGGDGGRRGGGGNGGGGVSSSGGARRR
jgi:uncharacterized membrane protein YgcG